MHLLEQKTSLQTIVTLSCDIVQALLFCISLLAI